MSCRSVADELPMSWRGLADELAMKLEQFNGPTVGEQLPNDPSVVFYFLKNLKKFKF